MTTILIKRLKNLWKDDRGFVMLFTSIIFLFIFVVCCSVYAIGTAVNQKIRLQNACDEAAYSAAVVEADGLSRMAVVNKALAWTYIQMTNKQMDYITLKWLKLLHKRYCEDKQYAQEFHWRTIFSAPHRGFIPLAQIGSLTLIAMAMDLMNDSPTSWNNSGCSHHVHNSMGPGWWCGLSAANGDKLMLNQGVEISLSDLESIVKTHATDENIADIGAAIDADKATIEILNALLESIAGNMQKSMYDTAQYVLTRQLNSNAVDRATGEQFLIRIKVPQCINPYDTEGLQTEDGTFKSKHTIFAPVYNTEAYERIILSGIDRNFANKDLIEFFGSKKGKANGLDQWFIRGEGVYSQSTGGSKTLTGSRRSEGSPGLQRVYKDANINETGSGFAGIKYNRGNHVWEWDLAGRITDYAGSWLSELAGPLFEKMLSPVIDNIMDSFKSSLNKFLNASNLNPDIQPSCRNRVQDNVAMCQRVDDSVALVGEYRWASAKWFCKTDFTHLAISAWNCPWTPVRVAARVIMTGIAFSPSTLYCGNSSGRVSKKIKGEPKTADWNAILSPTGQHYHIPKWYCGTPNMSNLPFNIFGVTIALKMIPHLGSLDQRHGYLSSSLQFQKILSPFTENDRSRPAYESCAPTPDGPWGTGGDAQPSLIRGHARIYGDDKEIWDERYIGAMIKPFLVNTNYFSGEGTILVAAARVQRNPFLLAYGSLRSAIASLGRRHILHPFDPAAEDNHMWAVSAARAGVRRMRCDAPERTYQVVYDGSFDPGNLYGYASHQRYNITPQFFDKTAYNPSDPGKPGAWKTLRTSLDLPLSEQIVSGCNCGVDHTTQWNLCETDWDAHLLPVRYAASGSNYSSSGRYNWQSGGKNMLTVDNQSQWVTFTAGDNISGNTGNAPANLMNKLELSFPGPNGREKVDMNYIFRNKIL